MNEMIVLDKIEKLYGREKVVDIDHMSLKKNTIYGLIGPNGAGKSTTMKMVCGLVQPTKGQVKVDGLVLEEKTRIPILRKMGSLIESPSYYDHLSAYDNMDIVRLYKGMEKSVIDPALEVVGLRAYKQKKVREYSLGMKQRLGIAMALMGFPPVLILDEPTNGLDPQAMVEIRDLIKSLPKRFDTTVMISSHALDEIEKMANEIGIIGKGKLLYQGRVDQFKARYKGHIMLKTSDNERASLLLEGYKARLGQSFVSIDYLEDEKIEDIVELLVENSIGIYRIWEEVKSLEDLFIDFTQGERL